MGRIRTDDIKKTSRVLINKYPDKFSIDIEKNKTALNEMKVIFEKKLRNRIAGYITRTVVVNNKRKAS
ncbi:MAG: 30S ribosomal protein S17e [Candidatus Aenigmarchaeota archaeon]|nr:30S ribosomal protein S17e [Candidatus Aenigmarchaeota archaeon]